MRPCIRVLLFTFATLLVSTTTLLAQTTSWKGVTSTSWSTATNWTNGVPSAIIDAVLGDANFTGVNQPTVSATSSCKSLTVGGTVLTNLTLTKNLVVSGTVTISANGTITHPASTLSLSGNWINSGTYSATTATSSVIFSGTIQSLAGAVQTIFRKLTVNAGSILTLNTNVSCTGASSLLSVSGTLHPNESPTYLTTADNLTVNSFIEIVQHIIMAAAVHSIAFVLPNVP